MRRGWMTVVVVAWLGCGPTAHDDDGAGGSAEGSGDTTRGTETSSGTGNSGNVDGAGDTTLGSASSSSGSGSDDGTTGSVYPAACVAEGWDDSLEIFTMLSEATLGNYYYVARSGGSGFTGPECDYATTIEALAGVVVRRSFEIVGTPEGAPESECTEQGWVEEADALGSHDSLFAAAPVTMESLYDHCCQLLAIEPAEEYFTAFGTDEAGVMVSCEATLDGCSEGCDGNGGTIDLDQVGFGFP